MSAPMAQSHSRIRNQNQILRSPESAYNDRHPEPQDVFWIVEIAPTSLRKDLELKSAIYAAAGIQEYWVLDLSAKHTIVFRYPEHGEYAIKQKLEDGIIIPLAFPDIRVSVERLLG